jgi:Ca2+-binding RTX toxin-like protein
MNRRVGVWLMALVALTGFTAVATPTTAQTTAPTDDRQRVLRCHGSRATIFGTRRGDTIVGTKHRDVIVSRGGSDIINARGGRDKICAGSGHDLIDGGNGRDLLWGDKGRDMCFGERTEHRHHKSCEVHRPSAEPRPPHHPSPADRASAAVGEPVSAHARRAAGDPYFQYTEPTCSSGQIDLGLLYLLGRVTSPSYVAVVTTVWYWDGTTGRWDRGNNIDPGYHTVPSDDQFHVFSAGTWRLRQGQVTTHEHVVWWWDPTIGNWNYGRQYNVDVYFGAVGAARFCST